MFGVRRSLGTDPSWLADGQHVRVIREGMPNLHWIADESARQDADREASPTRRHMAVVEDEGGFYVMTR